MTIPFLDLKAQYETVQTEIEREVLKVLRSTQFVLGPVVEAFEKDFAAYCGCEFGIGVNSGTSALHLALLAAGVGAGDEVITVSFTFVATAAAVRYTGARPVFVDVDPATKTMDVGRIEAAITDRTRAILPVHLHGQPADMDPIIDIAERHGLKVIEDAAQAHGAEYHGRRAGGLGHLGCFSFYPGKNLGACGEGGIVVTDDPDMAHRIRMFRDWGQPTKYHHEVEGFNYRMEGVQGAALGVKLRHLDAWTEARRTNAIRYNELLDDFDMVLPAELADTRSVYHVYAIRLAGRDALQARLQEKGIGTAIHYPIPVHLQKAHADLGYQEGDLPHSEQMAREVLSLPMYPELSAEQIAQVCSSIGEVRADG